MSNVSSLIRMHRRAFLHSAAGTAAIAALPYGQALGSAMDRDYSVGLAIIDSRFAHARAYARSAASRGVETLFFAGDLTKLWTEDLDLRWRANPPVTSGMTTAGGLHCLQFLAAGYRMHLHAQTAVATRSLPDPLVAWVLAPLPKSSEAF